MNIASILSRFGITLIGLSNWVSSPARQQTFDVYDDLFLTFYLNHHQSNQSKMLLHLAVRQLHSCLCHLDCQHGGQLPFDHQGQVGKCTKVDVDDRVR